MPEADVVTGRVIASGDSFPSGLERRALDQGAVLAVPLERVDELWSAVDIEEPADVTTPGRFTIDAASAERLGAELDPVDEEGRFTLDVEPGPALLCYYGGEQRDGPPYLMTDCATVELEVPGRVLVRFGQGMSVERG